jgi:hypothetical protein
MSGGGDGWMREQSSHRSHKLENGSSGKSYKYKFLK